MQAGIMHRGLKEEDASVAAVMRLRLRPWAMEIMRCGPCAREGGRSSGVRIGIVVRIPGIVALPARCCCDGVVLWHKMGSSLEPDNLRGGCNRVDWVGVSCCWL